MSVFSTLHRCRFSFLLLTIWLVTVLLLGHKSAHSHLPSVYNWVNIQRTEVSQKTISPLLKDNIHKTVLENGLTVLTKEVHTSPVVTVQAWYKVGSRHEEAGVNGIAHQLEHMMFRGTNNRPIQFGRLFSVLGSDSNAFTSHDQTAYYNIAERQKLKALLMLEADRMQNSLIDADKLAQEKRVVISELQGYENSSEYRLSRAVMRAAFPNHAYGLPVGGTKADVEKFDVEQVRKYYRNFYTPDNAVLVIVGDFQTAPTLDVVQETFGKIPKGRSQESEVRSQNLEQKSKKNFASSPIVLREPGAAAMLQAVYPLPDVNHPDVPALDVMDYILTEGRNSRLEQELVESGLASEVKASVINLMEAGWYELWVTAVNRSDLKKIDSVLNRAIANLATKGVTIEEVNRAKAKLEAALILGNRDISSLAIQLGNDETTTGNYLYTDSYLAGVRKVTPADVQRVANQYIKPQLRTVGFFEPTKVQPKEVGDKSNSAQIKEKFTTGVPVDYQEVAQYLPPIDSQEVSDAARPIPERFTLPNGMRVLLMRDPSTPTVTLSGYIKAGTEFDPENKAGIAAIVAENLMNGTKNKNVLTIAKALEDKGAHLDFDAYREGVRIEGNSLAVDLPILVQTLADVVKNATFPQKELELSRKQTLTDLKEELDDPLSVAKRTFVQSVYPSKHPVHTFPTEKSLQLISRGDVIDFKTKHYRPDTTVLALVGDFAPTEVRKLIESELGDWKVSGNAPTLNYPMVSMPKEVVQVNPILPGKAQAITYMGNTGINRNDSRYYSAVILNQILGGDTLSSRLGAEVRDRQGLTYGIYSNFMAGKSFGTFLIEMQTSPEDTTQAIASTHKLLKQIHLKGVTAVEVEVAKHTLLSNYIISLANPEDLIHEILMNEVYGLNEEELRLFTDKIQAVTLAQVNQAARELLHPDKIVVVTAGPSVQ
ncbi:M16 family metallopeptidase [Iningainema tapete]|uniref:Insulinase family protein n=1 Tax=Iningainema tapete BLCC-T55 TaxID=2748662 RepID=A0A8J6Y3A1_9CYAN|nr:pitrilysin family protein [Iningainema tapete]MBD2778828.1 insulinase family protein [Iningainema tapete BLCC-T55]